MTLELRTALAQTARRHRWDGEALYALVSLSTGRTFALDAGVDRWTPERTAVGLLQWPEPVARRLGVSPSPHPPRPELEAHGGAWATWAVAAMGLADQVSLLERYLELAFERREPKRPVDYYLAAWGAAPGLPSSTVVSLGGESKFRAELDADGDKKIQVADLERELELELARTRGPRSTPPIAEALWSAFLFVVVRRLR